MVFAPHNNVDPSLVEHDLRAVLEASLEAGGLATLGVARDGRIVHVSAGFFVMTGLEAEPARYATLDDLVHELAASGPAAADVAVLLTSAVHAGAHGTDVSLADGRVLDWRSSELVGGGRVWTFRNVTVERHAVRSLRDAENWLRMFAAHADGIVLELDAEARIVGLWSQGTSLFDRWRQEAHDRTLVDVLGPTQGAFFEARLREVLSTGRPVSFEYTTDPEEGEQRVCAANAVLLASEEGESPTVTVLVRDVTERARLQRQLLQSERLASLGLLAAGVAHEVNNPLAYMLLNMQHVVRGLRAVSTSLEGHELCPSISDFEQRLQIAVEGATRVQEIVQDLRRFSRSDEHEPPRIVDVRDVLSFTLAMIGDVGKRARVVRDFRPVPNVLAGEGRLNQVFLNLIINAVQSLESGDDTTNEVRIVTATDERGDAVVEVHDTGSGIQPALLARIFDPFFTTKAPGVGTGLGLAICHSITTALGGELTVESQVGQGSVFRVVLPKASGDTSSPPPVDVTGSSARSSP